MGKIDRNKIYAQIRPIPLKLNTEFELLPEKLLTMTDDFSSKYLGRGLLNHSHYHLTEHLSLSDEEFLEKNLHSRVEVSLADNIILTSSLKSYLMSKRVKQSGNWSLIIPSTSYAYPLLLTYHLILQHLREGLVPTLEQDSQATPVY